MARAVLTDENEKPKRAPRKRVVLADPDAVRTPRKRAPRKVAPKSSTQEEEIVSQPKVVSERRAPTTIATEFSQQKAKRKQLIIVGVLMVVGIGSSAAVGLSDSGKIDVNATIESRNNQLNPDGSQPVLVPVQNTSREADGGLVGLGDQAAPVVESASTSASSADATASSTEQTASSTPVGNIPLNEPDLQTETVSE